MNIFKKAIDSLWKSDPIENHVEKIFKEDLVEYENIITNVVTNAKHWTDDKELLSPSTGIDPMAKVTASASTQIGAHTHNVSTQVNPGHTHQGPTMHAHVIPNSGGAGTVVGSSPPTTATQEVGPGGFTAEEVERIKVVKEYIQTLVVPKLKGYGEHYVIAGGVFASLFNDEKINDFDIFVLNCKDGDAMDQFLPIDPFKAQDRFTISVGSQYIKSGNIMSVALDKETNFQYMFTKYATREELLRDFDYVHCLASYHNNKLYIGRGIFDAITQKKLIVHNAETSHEYRKEKFVKRGWTV